mgnify:CR=1 FL=1
MRIPREHDGVDLNSELLLAPFRDGRNDGLPWAEPQEAAFTVDCFFQPFSRSFVCSAKRKLSVPSEDFACEAVEHFVAQARGSLLSGRNDTASR